MPARLAQAGGGHRAQGTYYGPATISWTGSTVIIAADHALAGGSGAPTVLDYWYHVAGTTAWHEEQVATGVGYNGPGRPSIGWTGSAVIITDTDARGNLDYWYQDAGTTPWQHEHVATLSQAGELFPPSMASVGGHVVITDSDGSVDPVGDLDYWWKQVGTTDWHQQQVAAG